MRIIDLTLKDLSQIFRDKRSLLFLLVMPVLFTFFFGFVFSSQGEETDTRLAIAIINHDEQGLLVEPLTGLLSASTTVRPVMLSTEDAAGLDEKVLKGEYGAALIIPSGFSAGTLDGASPRVEILVDELSQNGQTVRRALQTSLTRLLSMAQSASLSLEAYEQAMGVQSESQRQAYRQDNLDRSLQAWLSPTVSIQAAGTAVEPENPAAANPYTQFSPGMLVMYAIFGLTQAATVLVLERRCGAMQRLLTTPMTKAEMIAGHLLSIFALVFGQQVILVAFGQAFLDVNYLREPLAVLLMMVALSLVVASLGLLIAALSRKEDQVIMMAMAAMFLFSALGGAWFSLEFSGAAFSTIGHLTPGAWAMDGFQNIVLRGLDFRSVRLPFGILRAYALAFFGIAVWRFKFE